MIRPYTASDFDALKRIHATSGLPPACFPEVNDKLFVVKVVAEENGEVVQAAMVKLIGEGYVLVDHRFSTPEKRWDVLQSLIIRGLNDAANQGLDSMSCWLPPEMERAFATRLRSLSFEKSPWPSYSALLR